MKTLLCFAVWLGAAAVAHAQLLPVSNARNPDWVLDKTTLGSRLSRPDSMTGRRDRMPIANPNRQGGVSAMPNALAKSISSVGNRHYYCDAARQLSYEWQSRPDQLSPNSLVKVRQQSTGATFTYRKRPRAEQVYPRKLN